MADGNGKEYSGVSIPLIPMQTMTDFEHKVTHRLSDLNREVEEGDDYVNISID